MPIDECRQRLDNLIISIDHEYDLDRRFRREKICGGITDDL